MKQLLNSLDTLTRRNFVERCAATSFGLSVLQAAPLAAADSTTQKQDAFGKAKRVIWLMLSGGLSHIDSLDPKVGKSKGPAKAINTSADFQVTDLLIIAICQVMQNTRAVQYPGFDRSSIFGLVAAQVAKVSAPFHLYQMSFY